MIGSVFRDVSNNFVLKYALVGMATTRVCSLFADLSRLAMLAYQCGMNSVVKEQVVDYFISSLGDVEFENRIVDSNPLNLEDACKIACRIESHNKARHHHDLLTA